MMMTPRNNNNDVHDSQDTPVGMTDDATPLAPLGVILPLWRRQGSRMYGTLGCLGFYGMPRKSVHIQYSADWARCVYPLDHHHRPILHSNSYRHRLDVYYKLALRRVCCGLMDYYEMKNLPHHMTMRNAATRQQTTRRNSHSIVTFSGLSFWRAGRPKALSRATSLLPSKDLCSLHQCFPRLRRY